MNKFINSHYEQIIQFFQDNGEWMLQLFLVWFFTILTNYALQRLLRKKAALFNGRASNWKEAFFSAIFMPLRVFVWVGGLTIACNIVYEKFHIAIFKTILAFQPALHTIIIGWFLLRVIKRFSNAAVSKYPNLSIAQLDMIEKISTIIISAAIAMLILPNFGISISGLLAFGGIGGIVVGLAAKDMLANVFGAIMLHFDSPFAVGDWVNIPEKDINGIVEHIGWRQVKLRTFDKRLMFIPNSMFGNMILSNPSKMTHRRFLEHIGVRYNDIDKVPKITQEIREYLQQEKRLDQEAGVFVRLEKFSAYSVDILVVAFAGNTDWVEFIALQEEILLKISAIISGNGAEIAFPTQVLQVETIANASKKDLLNYV